MIRDNGRKNAGYLEQGCSRARQAAGGVEARKTDNHVLIKKEHFALIFLSE